MEQHYTPVRKFLSPLQFNSPSLSTLKQHSLLDKVELLLSQNSQLLSENQQLSSLVDRLNKEIKSVRAEEEMRGEALWREQILQEKRASELMQTRARECLLELQQKILTLQQSFSAKELQKQKEIQALIASFQKQIALQKINSNDAHSRDVLQLKHQLDSLSSQLLSLTHQNQELHFKLSETEAFSMRESERLREQVGLLRRELQQSVREGIRAASQEREKESMLGQIQIQNVIKTQVQKQSLLRFQNFRMSKEIQTKDDEIRLLNTKIQQILASHSHSQTLFDNTILALNQKINCQNLQHREQLHIQKTNLMALAEADCKVLLQQLQRQGQDLAEQLATRQKQLQQRSRQFQQSLKEKLMQRKQYEVVLQKMRGQNRMLAKRNEEQEISFGVESQILRSKIVVQTNEKKKEGDCLSRQIQKLEEEVSRLISVIDAKDKQIQSLNTKFTQSKKDHEDETAALGQRLQQRDVLYQQFSELKQKELDGLALEVKRKAQELEEVTAMFQDIVAKKQSSIQSFSEQTLKLDKEILLLKSAKDELQLQLENTAKQHRALSSLKADQMQIHQQESKAQLNQSVAWQEGKQAKLAQEFESKVQGLERTINELRSQLSQKQSQILYWKDKGKRTEERVEQAVQDCQKLRMIRKRVEGLAVNRSLLELAREKLGR